MPELPEVETIRRQLAPKLIDAAIVDAGAHWSAKFTPALDAVGTEIVGTRRRGKYLLFDLDPGADGGPPRELVVHLGMTGRLAVHEPGSALALDDLGTEPHLRAWWRLDDDRVLTFHDIRRFGRIHVADSGDYRDIPTLHALGPEPWDPDFNGKHLAAFVKRSDRHLKTILLAQRAVAGVGNIYADEALWRSSINGRRRGSALTFAQVRTVVSNAREVMLEALAQGGTSFDSLYVNVNGESGYFDRALDAYGREGEPCRRCGAAIRREAFMNRSSYRCPRCQRAPAS